MEQWISQNATILGQLGLGAIFFVIYWYERKENKEMTRELKQAYKDNTEAFLGLQNSIDSLKESQQNALENNTRAVDRLVEKVDNLFRTNHG